MLNFRDPIGHTDHKELQASNTNQKLNWLRAAVLGANDGIVSTAAIIVGVSGASDSLNFILTAGIAGMSAGALSMAVGEYVSVSTQRDTEKTMLEVERYELEHFPEEELEELVQIYEGKGLSRTTAEVVAKELTEKDAFAAHVDAELGIDPDDLTNPLHAAYASALAFSSGALVPILVVVFSPQSLRLPFTFAAVILALLLTGFLSAKTTGANTKKAMIRVVFGGVLAMLITFAVGKVFGESVL